MKNNPDIKPAYMKVIRVKMNPENRHRLTNAPSSY